MVRHELIDWRVEFSKEKSESIPTILIPHASLCLFALSLSRLVLSNHFNGNIYGVFKIFNIIST